MVSTLPESKVGYSKMDLRNIEPLLVTPSSTISVNPTVISFSILRIFVLSAFPLKFSLIIAISMSSKKRLIGRICILCSIQLFIHFPHHFLRFRQHPNYPLIMHNIIIIQHPPFPVFQPLLSRLVTADIKIPSH